MRHYKKGRKLGTDASHTKAIKKSLVANLFLNDRIKTTLERAKEIRGDVDRVITWAKRGDVHSRRLAIAKIGDKDLVAEIFSKVAQGMFEGRPGGYSRIMRLGMRRGDSATIVIMELVQEPVTKKAAAEDSKAGGKGAAGKAATKKADKKADAKKADAKAAAEVEAEADEAEAMADEVAETTDEVIEAEVVEATSENAEAVEAEVAEEVADEVAEVAEESAEEVVEGDAAENATAEADADVKA
jgi:large subunit ribosomal protein L17